jgi:hypothetical protein
MSRFIITFALGTVVARLRLATLSKRVVDDPEFDPVGNVLEANRKTKYW